MVGVGLTLGGRGRDRGGRPQDPFHLRRLYSVRVSRKGGGSGQNKTNHLLGQSIVLKDFVQSTVICRYKLCQKINKISIQSINHAKLDNVHKLTLHFQFA
jgi:hypothetical protein